MLALITARIADESATPSAKAIAAAIGRMITAGDLPADSKLPTVRALSRTLGVSPTTVSEAWRGLAASGAIETRGRNGTYVQAHTGLSGPRRYRRITEWNGHIAIDLSTGTPDPDLLPDLGPAIASVGRQSLTASYLDAPVLPELDELLRADWPFPPEALTVVDGAMDALDRVAQLVLRLGDRVVVEHPAFPPLLDLLDQLGCEVIGVDVDAEGMEPEGLRAALEQRPTAVFLQPRAHNPTGVALTESRVAELAALLETSTALIIEDDHANDVSSAPLRTLGRWHPDRTVHIRSFSKSHGPDLRLAAVGGAGDVVETLASRRILGPGWSSRILQSVLVQLLQRPDTNDVLAHARSAYERRRDVVSNVLSAAGIEHPDGDGINLWMQVEDERSALVLLASRGVGAAPGTPFLTRPDRGFLRVTTGRLADDDALHVAELLVEAAGHPPVRTGMR
ncbi:MAG: aminotransferase class I/II-fold pyridoxal phosphate-dependent enzyme [Ilumatobacteraceae bacterium]